MTNDERKAAVEKARQCLLSAQAHLQDIRTDALKKSTGETPDFEGAIAETTMFGLRRIDSALRDCGEIELFACQLGEA